MQQRRPVRSATLLALLLLPLAGHADPPGFSYGVERFTQTGGPAGSDTFVDEFADGDEPPDGPSGAFTYFVACPLSGTAETGGALLLQDADLCIEEGEQFIDVILSDASVEISPGVGGTAEACFDFSGGITPRTGFSLELFSLQNGVSVSIFATPSGRIYAEVGAEGNGAAVTESLEQITAFVAGSTTVAVRFTATAANLVTASLDLGCDGSFEKQLSGSATLLSGATYLAGFGASADADPVPVTPWAWWGALAGIGAVGLRRLRRSRS